MTEPSGSGDTNASGQGDKDRVSQFSDADLMSMVAFCLCAAPPKLSELPAVRTLTFADVVQYFVEHQPKDLEIQGGALLRQPRAKGYHIAQVFLDEANNVCQDANGRPLGRVFVAESIDDELAAKFGALDLIIFT